MQNAIVKQNTGGSLTNNDFKINQDTTLEWLVYTKAGNEQLEAYRKHCDNCGDETGFEVFLGKFELEDHTVCNVIPVSNVIDTIINISNDKYSPLHALAMYVKYIMPDSSHIERFKIS